MMMNEIKTLRQVKLEYIGIILDHTDGNKMQAARLLKISLTTLKTYVRENESLKQYYDPRPFTLSHYVKERSELLKRYPCVNNSI